MRAKYTWPVSASMSRAADAEMRGGAASATWQASRFKIRTSASRCTDARPPVGYCPSRGTLYEYQYCAVLPAEKTGSGGGAGLNKTIAGDNADKGVALCGSSS